jgi:PAS domain S-box-containing protein
VLTVIHDVTREYEMRQQLTDRLQFIEKLLEASVDRIIVLDRNMNYQYWNTKAENYYGISRNEVVGRNILELFPGFVDDPSYESFRNALKGITVHIPASKNLDNRKGYFETYLIPIKDDKNNEVTGILWIVHDLAGEFKLALQQRKANHILESINECYAEVDFNGTIRYVNPRAELFWQKSKQDLLGQNIIDLFTVFNENEAITAISNALENHEESAGEFYSEFNNRWIYLSCTITGEGVILLFYDITDRRKVDEKLELQNRVYEHAEEIANMGTWTWDPDTNQSFYSDKMFTLFGLKPNEVKPGFDTIPQFIHKDDRDRVLKAASKVKEGQKPVGIEYRVVRKDGVERIFRNKIKLTRRENGGRIFVGTTQDITEESLLRRQLEERSKYAESIIDASINRILVYDQSFNIIAWNLRSEKDMRIPKEQAIGKKLYDMFPKVWEDHELRDAHQQALTGKHIYLKAKKSTYLDHYYERFYVPLKNEKGETYAVLFIMHDVTEMVLTSQQLASVNKTLERKNTELARKNDEITNFTFVASHDLKEPIRKLYTFTDMLLHSEPDMVSEKGKNVLKKIEKSIARMDMLIEDILILTKIHSGTREKEEVDLFQLCTQLKVELEEKIKSSKAKLIIEHLPVVMGTNSMLMILFRNLVENALKFQKPEQTPVITIKGEEVEANDFVLLNGPNKKYSVVHVSDNGIGFEPRDAKKIFQVFQRLHTQEEFEGTGMGLAICKKIMEIHGGFITATSAVGKGSTFSCYFPK